MDDETFPSTLIFNGLDGANGAYLLPEMTPAQVSALARGQTLEEEIVDELKQRAYDLQNPHAGVEADARDLSQTGWGVIFAYDAPPAVVEALQPLLQLRHQQAGERFKVFAGENGYRPGESKAQFLERHGMGPGPVNPDKVPYYMLIVGDPSTIPYRFQYQLDVQYAVGRLAFDQVEDYACYAQSVLQVEKGLQLPPKATFFGVSNADDRATTLSAENLIRPLAENLTAHQAQWRTQFGGDNPPPQWQTSMLLKDQATKASLSALLEGSQAPALLFAASHGVAFPNGDPRQLPHQGALVCQDWPGPQLWRAPIPPDFYFSADDLSQEANLLGMLAFFFACYGAGTPQVDEFAPQLWSDQPERRFIAPHDFVAALPRRMLSLPKGGALAVVGHVERAWGVSFFWGKAGPQLQVFEDCFERLMKGNYPVGYALEVFNNRYAEISSDLTMHLDEISHFFKKPNDLEMARLWTENNDALNYILLGDPAVRLSLAPEAEAAQERTAIPQVLVQATAPAAQGPAQAPLIPAPVGMPPESSPDYGLIDSFKQVQSGLGNTLQSFIGRLGEFLGNSLDEATSLEIATYVSDDMSGVTYENGRFSGARLRALTRIEIDGDTLICVPQTEDEVDSALWKIHMDMVQQAIASRAELLKTVVSAAIGLVDLIKP